MGFKAQRDAIIAVLTPLIGTSESQPLKAVQGFVGPTMEQLPVAMVNFAGGGNTTRLDSGNNLLTVKFDIFVVFRQSKTLTDENNKLDTLDTILNAFNDSDNVDTLNGACHKFDIESINPFDTGDPSSMMGFRIQVSCATIYPFT